MKSSVASNSSASSSSSRKRQRTSSAEEDDDNVKNKEDPCHRRQETTARRIRLQEEIRLLEYSKQTLEQRQRDIVQPHLHAAMTKHAETKSQLDALDQHLTQQRKKHASQLALLQTKLVTNLSKSREQLCQLVLSFLSLTPASTTSTSSAGARSRSMIISRKEGLLMVMEASMRETRALDSLLAAKQQPRQSNHRFEGIQRTCLSLPWIMAAASSSSSSSSSSKSKQQKQQPSTTTTSSSLSLLDPAQQDAPEPASSSGGSNNKKRPWSSLLSLMKEEPQPTASGYEQQQQQQQQQPQQQHEQNEKDRSSSSSSSSRSIIDPNVPLCPYELGGECSDPYCSYQHLLPRGPGGTWAKILPRELLPLPPLVLLPVVTSFYTSCSRSSSICSSTAAFMNHDASTASAKAFADTSMLPSEEERGPAATEDAACINYTTSTTTTTAAAAATTATATSTAVVDTTTTILVPTASGTANAVAETTCNTTPATAISAADGSPVNVVVHAADDDGTDKGVGSRRGVGFPLVLQHECVYNYPWWMTQTDKDNIVKILQLQSTTTTSTTTTTTTGYGRQQTDNNNIMNVLSLDSLLEHVFGCRLLEKQNDDAATVKSSSSTKASWPNGSITHSYVVTVVESIDTIHQTAAASAAAENANNNNNNNNIVRGHTRYGTKQQRRARIFECTRLAYHAGRVGISTSFSSSTTANLSPARSAFLVQLQMAWAAWRYHYSYKHTDGTSDDASSDDHDDLQAAAAADEEEEERLSETTTVREILDHVLPSSWTRLEQRLGHHNAIPTKNTIAPTTRKETILGAAVEEEDECATFDNNRGSPVAVTTRDVHNDTGDPNVMMMNDVIVSKQNSKLLLQALGLFGKRLLDVLERAATRFDKNSSGSGTMASSSGGNQEELLELYKTVDQLLVRVWKRMQQATNNINNNNKFKTKHEKATTSARNMLVIPNLNPTAFSLELLWTPLFAANIALACSMRLYDRAQHRLETLFAMSSSSTTLPNVMVVHGNLFTYSQLLWSQLVQLRICLPLYKSGEFERQQQPRTRPKPQQHSLPNQSQPTTFTLDTTGGGGGESSTSPFSLAERTVLEPAATNAAFAAAVWKKNDHAPPRSFESAASSVVATTPTQNSSSSSSSSSSHELLADRIDALGVNPCHIEPLVGRFATATASFSRRA
jgi:Putative zinc-finger domain